MKVTLLESVVRHRVKGHCARLLANLLTPSENMAKRRLSKQQQRRIRDHQAQRRQRAQQSETETLDIPSAGELGDEQPGLVIARYGHQVDVESLSTGEPLLFRCHIRANLASLVPGDRVIWCPGTGQTGVIVARDERRNELLRPDRYNNLKPVAANIDHILIVLAPEPEPHDNLIDRYLVAAEITGIPPVLLLNKADLLNQDNRAEIESLLKRYRALGYATAQVSAATGERMAALDALVQNQTNVFVGQSGVGKSSLIQRLLPHEQLRVGEISEATGKGTHTTTTARLYHLEQGGALIDSPGIREFGLWHMTPDQLEYGFVELRALRGQCRFRNCRHAGEPGCALDEAVETGRISPQRLASFRRIRAELSEEGN